MAMAVPLFRSDLQESILREIFRSPEPLSASDLARSTGKPVSSVSREVRSLVSAGILEVDQHGRRSLVTFDDSSPLVTGLRMILGAIAPRKFRPSTRLGWVVANHRRELVRLTQEHGLQQLRLFGSVARGQDGPNSDIDLLVDVPKGRSLADLARFAAAATDLLGVNVDVADSKALLPEVAKTVSREMVPL